MSADIPLPVHSLTPSLMTDLCMNSIKHILFIREQIPMPFEALREYDSSSCGRPTIRKIETLLSHFTQLEEDLNIVFSLLDVVEIQLFFGANVTSPREMYVLHMPPFRGSVDGETIEINEKKHRECLRRTIRSFIHYWGEVDCRPLPPSNFFIALRPSIRTAPPQLSDSLTNTKSLGHRLFSREGPAGKLKRKSVPPAHHTFSCKDSRKNDHANCTNDDVRINTLTETLVCERSTDQIKLKAGECNISGTWLVLKKGIKGLKNIKLTS